ncbi:MAG: amidohydrolase [Alphaproteobacteria bacterium]|nr:amidohydrolase [Alphaproteobacteria bacterium]
MRIFDCHSHWSTKRGYLFRTEEELASQERIWHTKATLETEQEMTDNFRRNNVRVILDLAITMWMQPDEIRAVHDYAYDVQKKHRDVIFGHWITLDPRVGKFALDEFERGRAANAGFIGFGIVGQQNPGFPPSDPIWDPFYKHSIDVGAPVLIHTGLTGIGQGFPGGKGIVLEHAHPRHIDIVAARFPELRILAARPAFPWQDDMLAILLHKANVSYEVHGWSPKYLSSALKKEIGRRLQDRVMFGCDYPVLKYEKMAEHWRALGYHESVLAKVLHENAERYFGVPRA